MSTTVSKSRFKAQALALLRRVEASGEPLVITDRGVPTLVVEPYRAAGFDASASLKGSVLRYEQPYAPVLDESDWEALA